MAHRRQHGDDLRDQPRESHAGRFAARDSLRHHAHADLAARPHARARARRPAAETSRGAESSAAAQDGEGEVGTRGEADHARDASGARYRALVLWTADSLRDHPIKTEALFSSCFLSRGVYTLCLGDAHHALPSNQTNQRQHAMKKTILLAALFRCRSSPRRLRRRTHLAPSKEVAPPPRPSIGTGLYFGLQAGINASPGLTAADGNVRLGRHSTSRSTRRRRSAIFGGIKLGYVFGTGTRSPGASSSTSITMTSTRRERRRQRRLG